MRDLVKNSLNDPEYMRVMEWQATEENAAGDRVGCLLFNAKNKMGGYGDPHYATAMKSKGGDWRLTDIDDSDLVCWSTNYAHEKGVSLEEAMDVYLEKLKQSLKR